VGESPQAGRGQLGHPAQDSQPLQRQRAQAHASLLGAAIHRVLSSAQAAIQGGCALVLLERPRAHASLRWTDARLPLLRAQLPFKRAGAHASFKRAGAQASLQLSPLPGIMHKVYRFSRVSPGDRDAGLGAVREDARQTVREPDLRPKSPMRDLFSFPNPVNDKAARVVAGTVLATVVVTLATSWYWLLIPLVYGFWARLLTGPTLSPLGWAAQNLIAPRLGPKRPVPGPPKRFAQGMGAVMSTTALVLAFAASHEAANVVLILFIPAAGLESIFGYCLGCKAFGLLIRAGLIPDTVCAECADIGRRLQATSSPSPALPGRR
jgi:hypothetical protein